MRRERRPNGVFGDVWAFDLANRLWMPRRLANIIHKTPLLRAASPAWTYDMQLRTLYVFGERVRKVEVRKLWRQFLTGDAGTETGEPRVLPGDPNGARDSVRVQSCRVHGFGSSACSRCVFGTCSRGIGPKCPVVGAIWRLFRRYREYELGVCPTGTLVVLCVGESRDCRDPQAPAPRYGQATAVFGNVIYIFGGTDNTRTFADLYALHVTGNPRGSPRIPGLAASRSTGIVWQLTFLLGSPAGHGGPLSPLWRRCQQKTGQAVVF